MLAIEGCKKVRYMFLALKEPRDKQKRQLRMKQVTVKEIRKNDN